MNLPSDMRRSWHSRQVYGLLHGHSFQTEKVLRGTPQLLALDSQVDAHAVDKGGWHAKREALLLALNGEPGQQQMPDSYISWDYLFTSSLHRAVRSALRSSPFFFLISAFLSLSGKGKRDRTHGGTTFASPRARWCSSCPPWGTEDPQSKTWGLLSKRVWNMSRKMKWRNSPLQSKYYLNFLFYRFVLCVRVLCLITNSKLELWKKQGRAIWLLCTNKHKKQRGVRKAFLIDDKKFQFQS